MLFDFDEGIASIYAYQLTGRGILPLRGVKTSLEFYNPPFFIYLISVPYLFSRLPTVAVGFLQLLQIGALAWLCFVLWRDGLRLGALSVAVFGALTPGPFWLTARLWGHAVIPVFSITAFICVYSMWRRVRCGWASALLPPVMAAAHQCHFSGALLAPAAVLALLVLRARVSWRHLMAGCGLGAALYVPYWIHLWQSDFADLRTIAALVLGSAGPGRNAEPMWTAAAHSFFDFGTNTALQEHDGVLRQGSIWASLSPLLWLSLLNVVPCVVRLIREGSAMRAGSAGPHPLCASRLAILGFIWCAVPLASLTIPKVELVPAYWLVALPGPWAILASLTSCGDTSAHPRQATDARWGSPWLLRLVRGSVAVVLVLTAVESARYHLRYVRLMSHPDPAVVAYPPYRDQRDAVFFVCEHSNGCRVRLTQDDRSEAGGVDYQILYLIAMREGNALRFSPESPEPPRFHYLIHNRARPSPRALGAHPNLWERQRFGLLDVYWRRLDAVPEGSAGQADPKLLG